MHAATLISPAATLASAFGIYWLTSRLPSQREKRQREQAVHDKLFGRPAVKDLNGDEIQPEVKSISAELGEFRDALMAKPALNGKFDRLFEYVSRHVADDKLHGR